MTQPHRYGCHNRLPFVSTYLATNGSQPIANKSKAKCQYTHTELGKADAGCMDCGWQPGGTLDRLEKRE